MRMSKINRLAVCPAIARIEEESHMGEAEEEDRGSELHLGNTQLKASSPNCSLGTGSLIVAEWPSPVPRPRARRPDSILFSPALNSPKVWPAPTTNPPERTSVNKVPRELLFSSSIGLPTSFCFMYPGGQEGVTAHAVAVSLAESPRAEACG